jgi:hypothetical protein
VRIAKLEADMIDAATLNFSVPSEILANLVTRPKFLRVNMLNKGKWEKLPEFL